MKSFIERLRKAVCRFLYIDTMPSLEMFRAMEMKQRERHDELVAAIQTLAGLMQRSRIASQQQAFTYEDYDSAMVAQMIEMQRNPEGKN
jgi:hypothetical protein